MDFSLSAEQKMIRQEIIRFAQKELNEGVRDRDRDHHFSRDLWKKCGEMGLTGLPVPAEAGGSGLDSLSTAMALEAFGYGCHDTGLVFSVCAHLLACVVPIWKHGSEEQKHRYLPGLCQGTQIAANAMSEPGSGSDVFSMSSTAVRDGDGYRLNGVKTFCTNGPVADLLLFYAVTDKEKGYHGGITAFLVETSAPGFHVGQTFEKMGLRTSTIGEMVLEDVRVPAASVLGKEGAGAAQFVQSMDWERICLFASQVGVTERLVEKAIEYARTRTQFGQTIGKFQAVSHRIAEMKIRLEAARLLTYRAAWNLEHSRSVSMDASIAKVFVSESLVQTALDTIQTFGGNGFMVESEIERMLRDAIGSRIYSGTNEMQKNITARWLGL